MRCERWDKSRANCPAFLHLTCKKWQKLYYETCKKWQKVLNVNFLYDKINKMEGELCKDYLKKNY